MSIADLRHLIALMQKSDIAEITVEREADDLRLRLRKPAPVLAPAESAELDGFEVAEVAGAAGTAAAVPGAAATNGNAPDEHVIAITAPLVGRFHLGTKPSATPLVTEGDVVRPGQVVGTIETLNLFNEVEASQAGRVVKVLAAEGQPVEYGQVLLQIEPLTA
jgi:acetyl-CoA carboxylase biotin carboxyl carrier protein